MVYKTENIGLSESEVYHLNFYLLVSLFNKKYINFILKNSKYIEHIIEKGLHFWFLQFMKAT